MESNNSLLSFVNIASSNIQEALGKLPKRRRNVTVKKFVENRVKRLDNSRRVRAGNFNRSKSAQLKRPAAPAATVPSSVTSMLPRSNTSPEINISLPPHPVTTQSSGMPTCAYPTTTPVSLYSGSESTVCLPPQHSSAAAQPIDPELESLLSELEGNNLSRHGSFDSVCTGTLSSTPPINTLETQVYLGEQMFSPYSDYSDELDSAYCSPAGVESTRVSYNSSPTNHGMPNWVDMTDMLPPVSSNCLPEMESRCNWENTHLTATATSTSSSSLSSVYDQGPPMTPTVSQLLQQYNQY